MPSLKDHNDEQHFSPPGVPGPAAGGGVSMNHRLLLSRTGEDEADILWDDENKSSALNGITYEFADRIVACVNACAGISNEALTSLDWQLAPKAGARPVDVAKLILTLSKYREALARIAAGDCGFADDFAEEALK